MFQHSQTQPPWRLTRTLPWVESEVPSKGPSTRFGHQFVALLELGRTFQKWDIVRGSQVVTGSMISRELGDPSLFSLLPGYPEVISLLLGHHRPKAKDSRDRSWTVWDGEQKRGFFSLLWVDFSQAFHSNNGKLTQTQSRRRLWCLRPVEKKLLQKENVAQVLHIAEV